MSLCGRSQPGWFGSLLIAYWSARSPYRAAIARANRANSAGFGFHTRSPLDGSPVAHSGAGVVIESRHPDFRVGDAVQSEFGWREHAVLSGQGLRKLPPDKQHELRERWLHRKEQEQRGDPREPPRPPG